MKYKIHKELPTKVKTSFSDKNNGRVDVEFEIKEVYNHSIANKTENKYNF